MSVTNRTEENKVQDCVVGDTNIDTKHMSQNVCILELTLLQRFRNINTVTTINFDRCALSHS